MGANAVSAFGKAWGLAFGAAFGLLAVAPPAEIDQGGGGLQSHAKPAQSVKNKPKQDQALVEHAQAAIKDIADSGGDSALEVGRNLSAQLFSPGGLTNHVTETHQTQQATQERGSPGESAEPLTAARVDIPAVPATPAGSSGSAGSVWTTEPTEPDSGRLVEHSRIADAASSIPVSPNAGEDTQSGVIPPLYTGGANQPLATADIEQPAIEAVADSAQSNALPSDHATMAAARAQDEALAMLLILTALESIA